MYDVLYCFDVQFLISLYIIHCIVQIKLYTKKSGVKKYTKKIETIDTRILESKTRKMDTKSNKRPREDPVLNKKRLVSKTIIYDESIANQWLDEPPLEVWDHHIIPLLSLRDLARSRTVCTFFEAYWQDKFSNNVLPLRVGNDVATIDDVMGVIEILSSRREYTKINPFVVLLGKGDHEITSNCTSQHGREYATTLVITRSNITFVGTGKDTTTILGGFRIVNFENITLKHMTLTNTSDNGDGIHMSNAEVELMDVLLKGSGDAGLYVPSSISATTVVATRCEFANNKYGAIVFGNLTSVKFKNCVFNDNELDGIYGGGATIHLHGDATAIHSNGRHGISAQLSCKVLIHLPSHHNTSYNNGNEDRSARLGGTITNVED